jgi:RNA polymerase sigma factor (sigma-70 family)
MGEWNNGMAREQGILEIVAGYGKQLLSFIRHRVQSPEDAEDVLQEVWQSLWLLPSPEDINSMQAWLYRVARNRIIDKARKRKEEYFPDDNGGEDEEGLFVPGFLADNGETDAETLQMKELFWELLFEALEQLPPNQRSVFERNELQDMTLQQIADEDGIPLKTAISRKRYAVLHLRNSLRSFYEDFLTD